MIDVPARPPHVLDATLSGTAEHNPPREKENPVFSAPQPWEKI